MKERTEPKPMLCCLFSKSGFTLVELLIVMVVILILTTLMIKVNSYSDQKTKTIKTIATLTAVDAAIKSYAQDHNGQYPPATRCVVKMKGTMPSVSYWTIDYDALCPASGKQYFSGTSNFVGSVARTIYNGAGTWLRTGGACFIQDGWGYPVFYAGPTTGGDYYTGGDCGGLLPLLWPLIKNPGSYDLYSLGPDGKSSRVLAGLDGNTYHGDTLWYSCSTGFMYAPSGAWYNGGAKDVDDVWPQQ